MTLHDRAAGLVANLLDRGLTIATGESLTAGLVASTLAEVPGCSAVLRGAVVAYHADIKHDLLAVSQTALGHGVVSREVAVEMARGAAQVLGADVGVGTTGVAGPDPHDGQPAGSVWIAVCVPGVERAEHLVIDGDRMLVRSQTVEACFELVAAVLRE